MSKMAKNPATGGVFQAIFAGAEQRVATGAAHELSNAFGGATQIVRLYCTEDVYLAFGPTPEATNQSLFLPAETIEYFGVAPGEKLSALQATAGGTLYITEGA
jgi:hypothetical protein